MIENPEFREELRQEVLSKRPEFRTDHPELKRKSGEDSIFWNAPVLVYVIGITSGGWKHVERCDCPMVCLNIMLAAHSLGIGSC